MVHKTSRGYLESLTISHQAIEPSQKPKEAAKIKDNNSIDENRTSTQAWLNAASSHTHGESNHQNENDSPELATEETVEHEMSLILEKRRIFPCPFKHFFDLLALSLEERTIDWSKLLSIHEQGFHSGSRDTSQGATSPQVAAQPTAPHHENFYRYGWFETLIILISAEALFLSFFVLLGAYGSYDSDAVLAPSQNPAQLFPYIVTWITLYAPGNSMIYAAYHLFSRASAYWKWRIRLALWYDSKYPDHIH